MTSMASILGKPQDRKAFSPDNRFVLPSALVGLEFEYEGVTNPGSFFATGHQFAGLWEQHREDSLKDQGAEFVFRHPLFGQDAYNAIDHLMDFAFASKWRCSLRAGIHVHVDVRDLEVPQLVGMIILYTIVEPLLYRWIGDNRENSVFCVPFYKADEALLSACSIITTALSDRQTGGHSALVAAEQFERYAGLNLQALAKFGSVEYRQMKTTHDKARVFDWVNMIMSLKAATFKVPTSDGEIVRMAQTLSSRQLLSYIFGNLGEKLWTADADELIRDVGIPAARDLALHGCSTEDWATSTYPKGEHQGFRRFIGKMEAEDQKAKKEIINARAAINEAIQVPQALRGAGFNQVLFMDGDPQPVLQIRRPDLAQQAAAPREAVRRTPGRGANPPRPGPRR